ncbi:hypothetical protein IE81DRAFT_236229 [Ceraceosorus guamensis]|uniref:Uncharacterized protein n=1 Tax=Ceraceosorus guamensis TaxID=1522189 RepID=A0A316VSJ9_9BASI|nr:hypothetical protein IE81DRAFT_236229 [Ceraceosorus guamensis]PWN40194.1 hypothetical protein IE81DRAFT_236229 [Ceraceosorus guamensis]
MSATTPDAATLTRRAFGVATSGRKDSSGLKPSEVVTVLGTFAVVFLLLLAIGWMCKILNKPSKEAQPYYATSGLYQPSAAGYGARQPGSSAATKAQTNLALPTPGQEYGARTSLLMAASPMGAGGQGYGSPGGSGREDYFSNGPSMANHGRNASSSARGGHARGESSGVRLPGPSAVARRPMGGASGQHPPLSNGSAPPDGGGFKPGQVFNHSASAYGMQGPGGPQHQMRAAPRGPPPASDQNRRRSRYARQGVGAIDSVGPGQIRKSMYMGNEGDDPTSPGRNRASKRISRYPSNLGEGGGGSLRRVDSVGRGDHRRRSQAYNANRSPSMYGNNGLNERATLRSAAADNFGAGRGPSSDPLGADRSQYQASGMPQSAPAGFNGFTQGPPGATLQVGARRPSGGNNGQQPNGYSNGYSNGYDGAGPRSTNQPTSFLQTDPRAGPRSPGLKGGPPRPMGPPSPGTAPRYQGQPGMPFASTPSPGMGGGYGGNMISTGGGGSSRHLL